MLANLGFRRDVEFLRYFSDAPSQKSFVLQAKAREVLEKDPLALAPGCQAIEEVDESLRSRAEANSCALVLVRGVRASWYEQTFPHKAC